MPRASFFGLTVLTLVATAGCTGNKPLIYHVYVGTSADDFQNDESAGVGVGPDGTGGRVVLFVNDNPIEVFQDRAVVASINQWIRSGPNDVSVSGSYSVPLYVKVARHRGRRFENVVAKKKLAPQTDEEVKQRLSWHADISYSLPLYAPGNSITAKPAEVEAAIRGHVKTMSEAIRTRSVEAMRPYLRAGAQMWYSLAYHVPQEKLQELFQKQEESMRDPDRKFSEVDVDALSFIKGPQSVLVYAGMRKEEPGHAYLFRFQKEGKNAYTNAMHFAFIDGAWVVWN